MWALGHDYLQVYLQKSAGGGQYVRGGPGGGPRHQRWPKNISLQVDALTIVSCASGLAMMWMLASPTTIRVHFASH
jgi:hypothetical protein